MARMALVRIADNIVANIITVGMDPYEPPEGMKLVKGEGAKMGDLYTGREFISPEDAKGKTKDELVIYARNRAVSLQRIKRTYNVLGMNVRSDATVPTRTDLYSLSLWGTDHPDETQIWTTRDGEQALTGKQFIELNRLVNKYVVDVFSTTTALIGKINSGDVTTVEQISIVQDGVE